MTDRPALKVGDRVVALGCAEHNGQQGTVIDLYPRSVRVEMDDGRRCWPLMWTLVENIQAVQPG